jgi:hypothetical protein
METPSDPVRFNSARYLDTYTCEAIGDERTTPSSSSDERVVVIVRPIYPLAGLWASRVVPPAPGGARSERARRASPRRHMTFIARTRRRLGR